MAKRAVAPIEDGRVRLRPLAEADLPLTCEWRNRDGIRRWFFNSEIITPEQHAEWYARYQERDDDFVFVIEALDAEGRMPVCRPVGQVALYAIDWSAGRAEFGRLMIGEPDAAGKGYAAAATRLALKIAFEQLSLHTVSLNVFSSNRRAIALYHAAGFTDVTSDQAITRMSLTAPGERGSLNSIFQ